MPPTQPNRTEAATAAALFLLAPRSRYNLPALVRQTGRKPRQFRRITPTQALAGSIAAPHLAIANAWGAHIDTIAASYGRGNAAVMQAVDTASMHVAGTVAMAKQQFSSAFRRIEQWHAGQWNSRVKASTGLDVAMFTSPSDVAGVVSDSAAWNRQLADDVHSQTKHRIASALITAFLIGAPIAEARARMREAVDKAKRRAAGIGDDQATKASRGMDRARSLAAGVDQFMWFHTPQRHPRGWHQARNGKVFGEGDIEAGDRAGVPPFCKCYEVPVFG